MRPRLDAHAPGAGREGELDLLPAGRAGPAERLGERLAAGQMGQVRGHRRAAFARPCAHAHRLASQHDVAEVERQRGRQLGAEAAEVDVGARQHTLHIRQRTISVLQRAMRLGGVDLAQGIGELERRRRNPRHRSIAAHVLAFVAAQQLDRTTLRGHRLMGGLLDADDRKRR